MTTALVIDDVKGGPSHQFYIRFFQQCTLSSPTTTIQRLNFQCNRVRQDRFYNSISVALSHHEKVGNGPVDISEGNGFTLPKAQSLEAWCKPRPEILPVSSLNDIQYELFGRIYHIELQMNKKKRVKKWKLNTIFKPHSIKYRPNGLKPILVLARVRGLSTITSDLPTQRLVDQWWSKNPQSPSRGVSLFLAIVLSLLSHSSPPPMANCHLLQRCWRVGHSPEVSRPPE
ncbi:hypothetical protein Sjap_017373 [Stephania japonica]|uniref:Uncharacterized protein n=1 Tax=Stephania japonica TaxID=461633 RepID=A0AAP0NJD0_9MAGN